MTARINMHYARTLLNRDPAARDWAEEWLKGRERLQTDAGQAAMSNEEFERHWRFVRPERTHEGAVEAVTAYLEQHREARS